MNTDISPDPAPETNKAGKKNKSFWLDTLQTVVFAVLIFLAINTITLRVRVYNISMRPTLEPGYFVLVNRLAYKWAEPGHGDVIVFHHQGNPKEDYVKRVIGLPGDTVDITGSIKYETYEKDGVKKTTTKIESHIIRPISRKQQKESNDMPY